MSERFLIGRDRSLVDAFAKTLKEGAHRLVPYGGLETRGPYETRRGSRWEARLRDPDGQPTGRIVRVTVELLEVESDANETQQP